MAFTAASSTRQRTMVTSSLASHCLPRARPSVKVVAHHRLTSTRSSATRARRPVAPLGLPRRLQPHAPSACRRAAPHLCPARPLWVPLVSSPPFPSSATSSGRPPATTCLHPSPRLPPLRPPRLATRRRVSTSSPPCASSLLRAASTTTSSATRRACLPTRQSRPSRTQTASRTRRRHASPLVARTSTRRPKCRLPTGPFLVLPTPRYLVRTAQLPASQPVATLSCRASRPQQPRMSRLQTRCAQ